MPGAAGRDRGGVFGIYLYAVEQGYSIDLARTIAVNTLVVMEIFHLLFIRNMYSVRLTWKQLRGTRVLWVAIALVVAGQFAITYLPPLQEVFETESVRFRDALLILLVGVGLFVIIELEKRLRLHLRPAVGAPEHIDRGAGAKGAGWNKPARDMDSTRAADAAAGR